MDTPTRAKPPGLICEDTLGWHVRRAVAGSNRLVYSEEKVGLAAWMIQERDQKHMTSCFLMENISSTTSYRVELEGALHLLQHIKQCGMESTEVEQWYDDVRAVHSTNEEIWSPKGIGKPEADIILAIHRLKKELPNAKDYKHVYAH